MIQYAELEFPKKNVMIYWLVDGSWEYLPTTTEIKLEFEENVTETELKPLPDPRILELQDRLSIRDDELIALRKLYSLIKNFPPPQSIETIQFSSEEQLSLHNLIGKQYLFNIGDSEYIKATEGKFIIMKDLTPILNVYIDY
jgi:hypothetical protein